MVPILDFYLQGFLLGMVGTSAIVQWYLGSKVNEQNCLIQYVAFLSLIYV
jgi:hypothetical protein